MGLIGWGGGKIGLQGIAYIDFEFGLLSYKYGLDWLGRRMNKLARNGV